MNERERLKLWSAALEKWRQTASCAACAGECFCSFPFVCTMCGDRINAIGEDMPAYELTGGQCFSCFYFDAEGNPRSE